jgi:tRNA-splicing ligase RtcB
MQVIKEEGSRPIKAWVGTKDLYPTDDTVTRLVPDIEDSALQQLKNLARCRSSRPRTASPSCPTCTRASVRRRLRHRDAASAIMPAAVGVDIGCGMNAVRLSSSRRATCPTRSRRFARSIERDVPLGNAGTS